MPLLDKEQSYTLLSMMENDGQTIMTFQRAIQSCDEEDFHITVRPAQIFLVSENVFTVRLSL